MGNFIDLTGQKFGRLTVIKRIENDSRNHARFLCQCDCGNFKNILSRSLKSGKTKSCGCLAKEVHSKSKFKYKKEKNFKRIYNIWNSMKQRCNNIKSKDYKNYGGRGIKVCDEWKNDFMSFYNWTINNGYKDDLTLDRIDVNGNYEPNNCRWVTWKEQGNNTRVNRIIEYNGKKKTLSEWAKELNINYSTLNNRINTNKWEIQKAFSQEVRKNMFLNRPKGIKFEQDFAEFLSKRGFWVHLVARTPHYKDQPCDIIVCQNNKAWLIDCKTLENKYGTFTLNRFEENQRGCYERFKQYGNNNYFLAILFENNVYFCPICQIDYKNKKSINVKNFPIIKRGFYEDNN